MRRFLVALALSLLALPAVGQSRSGSEGSFYERIALLSGQHNLTQIQPIVIALGFNGSLGSGAFETVWGRGGRRPLPPTPLIMSIRSTLAADTAAGTGARAVKIDCLDAALVPFSETLTIDGVNLVAMSAPCFRIQKAGVVAHGSSPTNEGAITVENAGTVYEEIPLVLGVPVGVSLSAVYTVPAETVAVVLTGTWSTGDNTGLFDTFILLDFLVIGRRTVPFSVKDQAQVDINTCISSGTELEIIAQSQTGSAPLTVSVGIVPISKAGGECPG